MTGFDPLVWALLALGWAVIEIIRRLRRQPRRLGTIDDGIAKPQPPAPSPPRGKALSDVAWGRKAPVGGGPRQEGAPATAQRRHPRRPATLHSDQMRDAVVLTTILGRCRCDEPYDGPLPRRRRMRELSAQATAQRDTPRL
jgi:hypothetical protein